MIIHPEEIALARGYEQTHEFEGLTGTQLSAVMSRGRELFHWFKAHPHIHNAINAAVIATVLMLDYVVLLELPRWLLPAGSGAHPFGRVLLASAVSGSLHSYVIYSLSVLSLHEGAAHRLIFVGRGPAVRAAQFCAENLCRLAAAEPAEYATAHMGHHAKFGTDDDPEFLNFVMPRRYFLTLLPYATFVNFTDFIVHRPLTFTRSSIISMAIGGGYGAVYAYLAARRFGLLFTALAFLVFAPHVGFYLDRLRQFTEHNLMPLENKNGARSFGPGFWGLLVGGGPWGQPCHLEHHLVPSIPWYQQLVLHRYLVGLMTPRQRRQFLIEPVIGYPRLWWRLMRELRAFARRPSASQP